MMVWLRGEGWFHGGLLGDLNLLDHILDLSIVGPKLDQIGGVQFVFMSMCLSARFRVDALCGPFFG